MFKYIICCLLIQLSLSCPSGQYYNSSSITCQNCSNNCYTCSSLISCSRCTNSNFYLKQGLCLECQEGCSCDGKDQSCQSNGLSYLIVGLILAPFALFIIIMIVWCCCGKEQQEEPSFDVSFQRPEVDNSQTHKSVNNSSIPLVGGLLMLHRRQWTPSRQNYIIDASNTCSICLDDKVDFRTNCNHLYHIRCFAMWVKRARNCPICKNMRLKSMKKYCSKCHRNYVKCQEKELDKYLMQFYDICIFCRDQVRRLDTSTSHFQFTQFH